MAGTIQFRPSDPFTRSSSPTLFITVFVKVFVHTVSFVISNIGIPSPPIFYSYLKSMRPAKSQYILSPFDTQSICYEIYSDPRKVQEQTLNMVKKKKWLNFLFSLFTRTARSFSAFLPPSNHCISNCCPLSRLDWPDNWLLSTPPLLSLSLKAFSSSSTSICLWNFILEEKCDIIR